MKVVRTVAELRAARAGLGHVGFVPTMGALHEGHAALLRQAVAECDSGVLSIFVNPTQFGPGEDFEKYPRTEEEDLALAEANGVSLVFMPTIDSFYPSRTTTVHVSGVTEGYEGVSRPTHFDGVATVVAKLFNAVRPDAAYFGLKDLQQCAVIRRMVADLDIPVDLRFVETVREEDGLALSSRNRYLSPKNRITAAKLYEVLRAAADETVRLGTFGPELKASSENTLSEHGFVVEYLDWVEMDSFNRAKSPGPGTRLVAAVRLGEVRLIDNVPTLGG